MPKKKSPVPAYRLHKPRGCACVTIRGKTHYLGKFGSPESLEKYSRLIAEAATNPLAAVESKGAVESAERPTITMLCAAYHQWASEYYRKNGRPTGQAEIIAAALRSLRAVYGSLPAAEFTSLQLEAVRETLVIEGKLTRKGINRRTHLIRRAFRWAESKRLVPKGTWNHLQTLESLQKHRTAARETRPVKAIDDATIEATIPYASPVVADMVRFQRLVGCRPTELCTLRPGDVDTTGQVWIYTPGEHKTEHHDRERFVFIGPKAQEILRPYLLRPADAYCFSPADSEKRRHEGMRERRQSKVQPSQRHRRKAKPKRAPRDRYDHHAYNRSIRRAIDRANAARSARVREELGREPNADELAAVALRPWHANQLRHAKATEVRRQYGVEGAQVILGHSQVGVTQVYAERDFNRAAQIAQKIG